MPTTHRACSLALILIAVLITLSISAESNPPPASAQFPSPYPIPFAGGYIATGGSGVGGLVTVAPFFSVNSPDPARDRVIIGRCTYEIFGNPANHDNTMVAIMPVYRRTPIASGDAVPTPGRYVMVYEIGATGEALGAVVEIAPDLETRYNVFGRAGHDWYRAVELSPACMTGVKPLTVRAWLPMVGR